jgi:hypothetical protein
LWIGGIVSVASLFLLVAFNVLMVQGQFDLERLAEERTLEQKQYEKLRDEVARLAAPGSIVPKATALGLVAASGTRFVHAPAAGAMRPERDQTVTTQNETRRAAKSAIDP